MRARGTLSLLLKAYDINFNHGQGFNAIVFCKHSGKKLETFLTFDTLPKLITGINQFHKERLKIKHEYESTVTPSAMG